MADPAAHYEEGFAEEAQEQAILASQQSQQSQRHETSSSKKNRAQTEVRETDSPSESSLLLGGKAPRRRSYVRASASYIQALHEPWSLQDERPWYKKPSIWWLIPAFFPTTVAVGSILVPRTYLIMDLLCRGYLTDRAAKDPTFHFFPILVGSGDEQCKSPEVERLVSYFNTYTSLLVGIPSAIVAPYFGTLSDRVGRRKVMLMISIATLLGESITILVGTFPDVLSVYWMLLGSLIEGLCGSFTTGLALSLAYASDCTAPENRATTFGYFHGFLFSGFAIGPILGGYLTKITNNLLLPFYLALGCHLYYIFFVSVLVPESLSEERKEVARDKYEKEMTIRQDDSWRDKLLRHNGFAPLNCLWPTGEGSSPALRRNLVILATIDTMMFGVAMGTMSILIVYTRAAFDWDTLLSSVFMSTTSSFRVVALFVVLPIITRFFGRRIRDQSGNQRGSDRLDLGVIIIAVIFEMIGYFGYALSPTTEFMFLSGLLASMGGIGSPTLQSSMTKHLPVSMTGQILGASALLHAAARVVAPSLFNLIFAATLEFWHGFVFFCLAFVFVFLFILSWFLKPHLYLQDESLTVTEVEPDHMPQVAQTSP